MRCLFRLPGQEEDESDAGADGAVGDVEGGEADFAAAALPEVEVDEVNHVTEAQAIGEVAENAADDEAEGQLAEGRARIKMVAREIENYERHDGDDGEDLVASAEHAPGRTAVFPMDEFEKAVEDNPFLGVIEKAEYDPFRKLIQREDSCGDG